MASKKRRQDAEQKGKKTKAGKGKEVRAEKKGGKRNRRGTEKGRRKQGGLTIGKKVLLGFCIVLLIFVLVAIVGVAYVGSKMGKLHTGTLDVNKLSISDELKYDETGYLNVALFGLDSRANDESMGSRSDTIIVASLNRETKEIKMASIYRDTLLQLDDGEYYKANAAYSYGKEEEAVAMLNRNFDLNIDHYVTVDFSALVDVIDAVGGIEVDVKPEEIEGEMHGDIYSMNGYIMEIMENTGKESAGVTEPGLQKLNGIQATAYARIRYTDGGDFERAERQRLVLEKVAQKLRGGNLITLNKIIDSVFPKVRTNFKLGEILAYAKDVKKFQFGQNMGFPINPDNVAYKDQGSCVAAIGGLDEVKELHKYFFGEDGYVPTSTVRSIWNELDYIYNSGGAGSTTYSSDNGTDYTGDSGYYGDGGSSGDGSYGDGSYGDGNSGDGSYDGGSSGDGSYGDGSYDSGTGY